MPTYDYKCDACGELAERRMSVSQMENAKITCQCGLVMRRDYVKEHGGALAFESRQKGRFPFVCHDLTAEPTTVYDMAQLQGMMARKKAVPHQPDADARARYRDKVRRFY